MERKATNQVWSIGQVTQWEMNLILLLNSESQRRIFASELSTQKNRKLSH